MTEKRNKPRVNLPSSVKVMAMLSPKRDGKVDRRYLKAMASAISSYDKHKNDNIKKIIRETSSED